MEGSRFPELFLGSEVEVALFFYEESLEELELARGPIAASNDKAGRLRADRLEHLLVSTAEWRSLDPGEAPEWTAPFIPRLPCRVPQKKREHRFAELSREFQPSGGLLPALTTLVPLDETHALVASFVGLFYRFDWPREGEPRLVTVLSSTVNYHLAGFRQGDAIYLGGTGARVAEAELAPLLEDPPRLVLRREIVLADRPHTIDHAVVSISGDPDGAEDLFFMAESTEVFHLGPDGVRELGPMDARMPAFSLTEDRQLRARQIAWVAPGRAVAAWFYDENHRSEPGPVLLSADGDRSGLPLPAAAAEFFASATSVAFDPSHGLFVARSSFENGGLRAEIFRRGILSDPWHSFALVEFAVQNMVPEQSAVFAVGAVRIFAQTPGAGMRAQRGFDFQDPGEKDRCLWFHANERQRLVARMAPGRLLSTGTTVEADPPWIFTHELEIPHDRTSDE